MQHIKAHQGYGFIPLGFLVCMYCRVCCLGCGGPEPQKEGEWIEHQISTNSITTSNCYPLNEPAGKRTKYIHTYIYIYIDPSPSCTFARDTTSSNVNDHVSRVNPVFLRLVSRSSQFTPFLALCSHLPTRAIIDALLLLLLLLPLVDSPVTCCSSGMEWEMDWIVKKRK